MCGKRQGPPLGAWDGWFSGWSGGACQRICGDCRQPIEFPGEQAGAIIPTQASLERLLSS